MAVEGYVAGCGQCTSTSESLYREEVVIVSSLQPSKPSDLSFCSIPSPCLFLSLSVPTFLSPPILLIFQLVTIADFKWTDIACLNMKLFFAGNCAFPSQ